MHDIRQKYINSGKFLIFYALSFLVASVLYTTYLELVESQMVIKQRHLFQILEDRKNDEIFPKNIEEIALLVTKKSNETRRNIKYNFQYYPAAYMQPGKVLFQSSLLLSDVITFGDGSQAVVTQWQPLISGNGTRIGPSFLNIIVPGITFFVLPAILFWLFLLLSTLVKEKLKRRTA